jgi:hypothetical protein
MIQWLPVGTRMAKYGNEITMCYFCDEEEDFQHLFCCTRKATQHKEIKKELMIELQKIGTEPEIQTALIFWIYAWMTGDKKNNEPTWSHETAHAIQQQRKIGWNKVISGLFSIEWSTLQERFNPASMGDCWQSKLCNFMTNKAHQLWIERNDKMYKHNNKNKVNREEEEILSQVRNLYATQQDMNHHDAIELFGIPIERRITFTTAVNKAWIIPTRREALKWCKTWLKKLKSKQPDIRQFIARKRENLNDTMEMAESVGSIEEESNKEDKGDEEEEESDIGDATKIYQQLTQTPGPCTRESLP